MGNALQVNKVNYIDNVHSNSKGWITRSVIDKKGYSQWHYKYAELKDLDMSGEKTHPSIAKHRTEKPIALLEWLINTYTDENMVVMDNTMGSGTTGVACKNTNRSFIGIEKDENYFKIAEQRINARTLFS